jgi:Tfp pilus assembly protein PilF
LKSHDLKFKNLALCLGLVLLVGCSGGTGQQRGPGFQTAAERGDPQRRASMRLVLQGIEYDQSGDTRQALSRYERSLQIDSGNPYAHLALARHFIELGDTSRGLVHLDQSRTMFEDAGSISPVLEAHLLGLRGAALRSDGRLRDGQPMLDHAARLAPDVWSDGQLDSDELR